MIAAVVAWSGLFLLLGLCWCLSAVPVVSPVLPVLVVSLVSNVSLVDELRINDCF